MDPSLLTVYKSPFKKIRLGKDYDGGYIIADIENVNYAMLIAGGIENDLSFEEAFVNKYTGAHCFAYDGTINSIPTSNPNITFIKKNIGPVDNLHNTNLIDLIEINNNINILVKMDIEGAEIPWLQVLSDKHFNKIDQIVMEFHNPFSETEAKVFDKLNKNYYLIHFHPNNCCGVRNHMGIDIPNIFECTYVHKKHFTEPPVLNTDPIPEPIDMKNTLKEDIVIDYPPFVHKA